MESINKHKDVGEPQSSSASSTPTILNLLDREHRYPVYSCICDHLDIASIIALTRTCKKLSNLYRCLVPTKWDINKRLRRFVDDPSRFRSLIGRYDALISGSFAVQFFERVMWHDSDLDLYVEDGPGYEALCKFVVDVEGYRPSNPTDLSSYEGKGLVEVRTFTRPSRISIEQPESHEIGSSSSNISRTLNPKQDAQIQIVASQSIPVQAILQGYYTTAIVNFITWNKAFSVFPLTTFVQYKGYMLRRMTDFRAPLVTKYTTRGWNIQELMWDDDQRVNGPIRSRRRVGDRYTWVLPLETQSVQWSSSTPDFVLEHACFSIPSFDRTYEEARFDGHYNSYEFYEINAPVFEAHVFRYKYTCHKEWLKGFLEWRATRLTAFELRKMKPDDRPTEYVDLLDRCGKEDHRVHETSFPKPAAWKFWDADVPAWYKACEESPCKG